MAVGLGALAGTAYTAILNPNTSHAFPLCPLKYFTGYDCPLCGALRAVHSLTHGDVIGAADHNVMFVAATPFLVLRLRGLAASVAAAADVPQVEDPCNGLLTALTVLLVAVRA